METSCDKKPKSARRMVFWGLALAVIATLTTCYVFSDHFGPDNGSYPTARQDIEITSRDGSRYEPPTLPRGDDRRTILPEGVGEGWPGLLGPAHDCSSPEQGLDLEWPKAGPFEMWRIPVGSGYSAPVVLGDRLILLHRKDDDEIVDCLDAANGQS
jgi:hypothetical protein